MRSPLTKAAHSGLLLPPSKRLALGFALTRSAQRRAIWYASESMTPTAVANESIKRRFASWITGAGKSSNVNCAAYAANRSASGWLVVMHNPVDAARGAIAAWEPDAQSEGDHA